MRGRERPAGARDALPDGFTLIELLIVVAIVAILAAIATPNLIEAQARSKVARVLADQRTLATALESYSVDNTGQYPAYGSPCDYSVFVGEPIVFVPALVTTPVAYLTSLPPDAFPGRRSGLDHCPEPPYFYMHNYAIVYLGRTQPQGHVESHYETLTGRSRPVKWTVWSFGPDRTDDHGTLLYDPTNGTKSAGDVMRFGP